MPTLPRGQVGLYEQPLTGNTVWTVQVEPTYTFAGELVEVINHGNGLVYVRPGPTIALRDPMALIVGPSSWVDLPIGAAGNLLALISSTDGVVSIARKR